MKLRTVGGAAMALTAWLVPTAVDAHRVDEYLQATRLSIDRAQVGIEISLTPGVDVAPTIFRSIDADGNGRISQAEGAAYARQVLSSVALAVDAHPVPVAFVEEHFPEYRDMQLGMGTIRLRGLATISTSAAGHHQLEYRNAHRPDASVYLVNVLVPSDRRIQIGPQRRDAAQHWLRVEYDVGSERSPASAAWLLAGGALLGGLAATRRSVTPKI